MTRKISAEGLNALMAESEPFALLDVREHGQYGEGHLLFASNCPYSRLELRIQLLVPDMTVPVVLYDDADGVAERAAERMIGLGYRDVAVLAGGIAGWEAAGHVLYKGVNVPSKVLGELVELAEHTPQIGPDQLHEMQRRGESFLLVDGRPSADYRKMTIPGARSIPNGELLYRLAGMGLPPDVPIVVHCAGRTRGLIGAQSLINAGVPNPVFALENGTQGWVLSGRELVRGAEPSRLPAAPGPVAGRVVAGRLIDLFDLPLIAADDLHQWKNDGAYLLDVRTRAEYDQGHVPGSVHAPVVQLVQATDEWVAVRHARIALIDDNGVRAASAAMWLRQMGHDAVVVEDGLSCTKAPVEIPKTFTIDAIAPEAVAAMGAFVTIVDLRPSMAFRKGHIRGACWSIRPHVARIAGELGETVVLVSEDQAVAELYARDLAELSNVRCLWLGGKSDDWHAAGLVVESSPESPPDADAIDFLFFVHDRHDGNLEASRTYLAWETGLVSRLEPMERAQFHISGQREA